ncbi:MAG TPA: HisA/HisF-related TIM barrel protein [Geminicoccaceae bacterium]|nr:HisA/HisF-related TIM barrel protein [Geminicoccus sp.]HMU52331.1 HisA/HisF-related TIM barrel protein [Geminicoccaceae bacterium]
MGAFEIIPVIDLMAGVVVHARAGERDRYRPLAGSRLCGRPQPAEVVAGLLALHPFRRLYIADLDAIAKRGGHGEAIADLSAAFPGLELWIDAGAADAASLAAVERTGGRAVLGSESQQDARLLAGLDRAILSLDMRGAERLDPAGLFDRPELWPGDVIVMTLASVGAGRGPDLPALRRILASAGERRIWAAGGVRDAADLEVLAALGCAGVLVATALHDGRLGREELAVYRR